MMKSRKNGEGPVGTKDAIWVKIVGQKLKVFQATSYDFIIDGDPEGNSQNVMAW